MTAASRAAVRDAIPAPDDDGRAVLTHDGHTWRLWRSEVLDDAAAVVDDGTGRTIRYAGHLWRITTIIDGSRVVALVETDKPPIHRGRWRLAGQTARLGDVDEALAAAARIVEAIASVE